MQTISHGTGNRKANSEPNLPKYLLCKQIKQRSILKMWSSPLTLGGLHVCLPARSVSASRVHLRTVGGGEGGGAAPAWHVAVSPKGAENTELSGRGLSREQGPSNALGPLQGSGSYPSAGIIADQLWGHLGAWSGLGAAFTSSKKGPQPAFGLPSLHHL